MTQIQNGKGDKPRPHNHKKYCDNYDRIFKKTNTQKHIKSEKNDK
jgi:hypothetical protein